MNQYAVIPVTAIIAIADCIATPDTWQFDKGGQRWGGYEKRRFSTGDIDAIQEAGGEWFASAEQLKKWLEADVDYIGGRRVSSFRDYKQARERYKEVLAQAGGFEAQELERKRMAARWFLVTIQQIDSVLTFEEKLQAADRFNRRSIESRSARFNAVLVFVWNAFDFLDAAQIQQIVLAENFEYMYIQKGQEGTMMVNYDGVQDQPGLFDFVLSTPGTRFEANGLGQMPLVPKYTFTMPQIVQRIIDILQNGNY